MKQESLFLWPSIVMTRRYEKPVAFNKALVDAVTPRAIAPPVERSTGGTGTTWNRFDPTGWHGNLFADLAHVPEMGELRAMMEDAVKEYIRDHLDQRYLGRKAYMRGFANFYENGSQIMGHHHGGVHLATVYYPQAGIPATDNPTEGRIVFSDPRGGIQQTTTEYGQRYAVTPEDGMLLVIPGYLAHETGPYFGSPPRVAISADVLIQYANYNAWNEPLIIEQAGVHGGRVTLIE